ncbi:hypothetical protein OK016_07450 [Vibrio chagasii]|nr:hypothetical protein [Vibrio chagasii]
MLKCTAHSRKMWVLRLLRCLSDSTEYHRIRADRAYMDAVMKAGAEKASERAAVTLKKAYEAVGFA